MTHGGIALHSPARKEVSIKRGGYLPQLDGLRAIGIILVLIHHGLQPLEFGGYVGVDIFFALSGYLITGILLREWRKTGGIRFRNFYIRRAIRLYPALLFAVAIVLPFGFMLWGFKHLVEAFLAVTYTTPLVVEVFGKGSQIWLHTWSLGIEEMFYLAWPVALVALLKFGKANWLLVGTVGGVMLAAQVGLVALTGEASFFLRAGAMFLGCALALWQEQNPGRVSSIWLVGLWPLLLVASVAVGSLHGWNAAAFAATGVATVGILASVTSRRSAVVSLLSTRPVVYVGKISYELYIWHYAVLVTLRLATDSRLIDVAWYGIPISIVLAVVTHHLFTKRIDTWKRKFTY